MNRSELIEILATKSDISKAAAGRVLDTLIDTIQTTVKKGDTVSLVGFGTFKSAKPECVNDFATPGFINLRCRVVLFQSASFGLAVG